jgi:hypothetical protein
MSAGEKQNIKKMETFHYCNAITGKLVAINALPCSGDLAGISLIHNQGVYK